MLSGVGKAAKPEKILKKMLSDMEKAAKSEETLKKDANRYGKNS